MRELTGTEKVQDVIERMARLVLLSEYREELSEQQIKLAAYDIALRSVRELGIWKA